MAPLHDQAAKKQYVKACDNCFRQKVKCDGERPRCEWCDHRNVSCTYERKRQRAPKGSSNRSASRKRIPQETSLLSEEPQKPEQTFPFFHHVGNINLSDGAVLFSPEGQKWIEHLTGEKIPEDLCLTISRPWERGPINEAGTTQLTPLEAMILPDRALLERVTRNFFDSGLSRVWPLPDPVLFKTTMDLAYRCRQGTPSRIHTAKICLWAAWAFISVFPGTSSPLSSSHRADIVNSLMASINLLQQPHIDLLQAMSMLVIIHLLTGNVQAGILSNTVAARYVLLLGGNTRDCFKEACKFVTTGDDRFRPDYHLRNLFWMCYQQDKELCLRSGQPPAMSEYNCDLDLPIGYERDYNLSLGMGHCINPVFPGDLRLSQIKSNAYCDLFSRRALEKDGVLILSNIRQLDRDLEQWRMSIPADYRPTLLFSHDTSHPPGNFSIRALMMRLEYYYCMAYIHQACGRFRVLAGNQDWEIQGISSSLTLSLATCRSSLYCLLAVQDALSPRDFWLILFYPLSAIFTMFCHIISNPRAPEVMSDLELIRQMAVHVRELGEREGNLNEGASNSDRVWKVITALENLGRRTVEKHSNDVCN